MASKITIPLTRNSRNILSMLKFTSVNTYTTQKAAGQDLVTHTGQSWEADDHRNVRYLNTPKQVNSKWSIDLIQAVPPIEVEERVAVCEGGPSEALGHPKIYINLDQPGNHSCSYCGLRFVKKAAH